MQFYKYIAGAALIAAMLGACSSQPPPPTIFLSQEVPVNIDGRILAKDAHWVTMPNASRFAYYYPDRAQREYVSGNVRLLCRIASDGKLKDCTVAEESPVGYGFGTATLKLAQDFRLPAAHYGPHASVEVPIHWRLR